MGAQIAPAAVRAADEGPGYDLISLGLVVFSVLLIGVWTPYWFRQQPAGLSELDAVRNRLDLSTSAGNLQAARWADCYFRTVDCTDVSVAFTRHLREALRLEAAERAEWERQKRDLRPDQNVEARIALSENPEGPAARYAKQWYENRAAWLDARDTRGFNAKAHIDFSVALREIGMGREAELEKEKVRRARPDWPGLSPDDGTLPVIREHGTQQR